MKTKSRKILDDTIDGFILGKSLEYKNMEVVPIFSALKNKVKFLTMNEALQTGEFEIVEKNTEGSVPELKAVNRLNKRVLLLEGEELSGSKQNRILNTSMLLRKNSEILIPVSCTEKGRWSYTSKSFFDSDIMAPAGIRNAKIESVSRNLEKQKRFSSNQNKIWEEIDNVIKKEKKLNSRTSAMKDVFDFREDVSNKFLANLPIKKNQQGIIVFINGKISGLEFLSSKRAFERYYKKLIGSYISEAISKKQKVTTKKTKTRKMSEQLLKTIKKTEIKKFKSLAHGFDLRLNNDKITGSALKYRDEIIHIIVLSNNKSDSINGQKIQQNSLPYASIDDLIMQFRRDVNLGDSS